MLQEEHNALEKECKSLRDQVTVTEAGSQTVMHQYQTTVEEMEVLKTHCKMMEGQLAETKVSRVSVRGNSNVRVVQKIVS